MREIKFRAWVVGDSGEGFITYDVGFDSSSGKANGENGVTYLQYTGLKDKNGVEIYEGDIIWFALEIVGNKYMGQVVFDEGCFQLKSPLAQEQLPLYGSDELEVIGNIMENPELLK